MLLDAGDALAAEGSPEGQVPPEGVLAGMNLMGYSAMAIGPLELELGESTLRRGLDEAEFPMLSANAFWSGDRGLVGEPYTVLKVGSYRFGVIGLTRIPNNQLADVAKLGMVLLYFKTFDGQVGKAIQTEQGWEYKIVSEREDRKRILCLFDSMEKHIREGYFELPNPS